MSRARRELTAGTGAVTGTAAAARSKRWPVGLARLHPQNLEALKTWSWLGRSTVTRRDTPRRIPARHHSART